jgi:hypothetical protein
MLAHELGLSEVAGVIKAWKPPKVPLKGLVEAKRPSDVEPPYCIPPPGIYNSPLQVSLP